MTKPANENVLKAIEEFKGYLDELDHCTEERRAEIEHQTISCSDLMDYSYEVANTAHPSWMELERLLSAVMDKLR